MPAGDYWLGLAFFAVTVGGCLAAAWLVVVRRLPPLPGTVRWLAFALLATAALLVAHLLPAVLTVLSRETAALVALALAAGATRLPRAKHPQRRMYPQPAREAGSLDRGIAWFGVLAFVIWLALVALKQLYAEPVGFDAVSAYLPTAANWLQEGSIWGFQDWVPNFFFGAAPGNGTVVLLATMLPWDNDFLTHFAIYPFVAMTGVAIHALAREAGAPRPFAALLGVMLAAAPVVVSPALRDALLDPVLYATFASGVLFLVRHHRTGERSDLLLAGLGLGIAFGTKFYGFTAVPIVIVVWALARLWVRVPAGAVARQAAVLLVPAVVFGGFWVARNWVETGNPAYPVQVEVAGLEIFDAPDDPLRERLGTTLADYFDQPSVWSGELRRQFRIAVGIPLILLGIAIAVAVAYLVRRRGFGDDDDSDGPAAVAVALALALALSYALTPYSAAGEPGDPFIAAANVRYGIPALIVAVAVAGWVCSRLGPYVLTASGALAVGGLFDALRIGVLTPRSTVYGAFVLAALAVGALWLVRRRRGGGPRATARARSASPRLVLGLATALVVALALFGSRAQETFNETRYAGKDPVLARLAASSSSFRIGLAGNWSPAEPAPVYPAFGKRLQNEVEFVGADDDGLLRRITSREPFVAALEEGSFDLLLVGLESPTPEDPGSLEVVDGAPPEEGWADAVGFEEIARSDRFALMAPS